MTTSPMVGSLGARSFADVKAAMLQHVESLDSPPPHWPSFNLLR